LKTHLSLNDCSANQSSNFESNGTYGNKSAEPVEEVIDQSVAEGQFNASSEG
jgi:hypothetical protein